MVYVLYNSSVNNMTQKVPITDVKSYNEYGEQ